MKDMDASLEGNSAIVTGASKGIGRETGRALAREGADVALVARSEEKLNDNVEFIRDRFDTEAIAIPADVSDFSAVEEIIRTTAERFDGIDILVNNAGIGGDGTVEKMPVEAFERQIDVNVSGVFYATKLALPHLRRANGKLIFIGSFAGQYPRPKFPVYAATKWWVRGFALSVAGKYGEDGVATTIINPATVRTNFGEDHDQSFKERFGHDEAIEPEEVADTVVFASSQRTPITINAIDIYTTDKLSHF